MNEKRKFLWDDEYGIGFYPVLLNGQYNREYWEEYVRRMNTLMGETLNRLRTGLVEKHIGKEPIVDVGVGAGHFMLLRGKEVETYGYDVNPVAIEWLLKIKRWWDPYFMDPENASLWDVLEHVARPDELVQRVKGHVFVSIPIVRSREHAIISKHFKPNEHFWYFTREGLLRWMKVQGFNLVEENLMETEAGREEIGTFVFKKGELDARKQG